MRTFFIIGRVRAPNTFENNLIPIKVEAESIDDALLEYERAGQVHLFEPIAWFETGFAIRQIREWEPRPKYKAYEERVKSL